MKAIRSFTRYLLLLMAALLVLLFLAGCSDGLFAQAEPTPTLVPRDIAPLKPTYEVQTGDIVYQSQFLGRVVPVMEEQLFFPVDGHIRNIYVTEGEAVSAGQVLADLSIIDELNRQQALNDIAVQRAELRLEQARLRQELTAAKANPETRDIEVAIQQIDVDLARIALDELLLQLAEQESGIESGQLIAPFDGQILALNVEKGDRIAAFDNVILLADLSELEVGADLQRTRVDEMEVGMTASISHANRPGETITGSIRRLPYRGAGNESAGQDTAVHVALQESPQASGFDLDDRVQVTVTLEQKSDVLWLPPPAIRSFGGRQFVVVQEGDTQRRVDVTLGLITDERVEIVDGLTAGQIVIGP